MTEVSKVSMDFLSFLNFNTTCPICEKQLTPYLQISNGPLFKGSRAHDQWAFTPFKLTHKHPTNDMIHLILEDSGSYHLMVKNTILNVNYRDDSPTFKSLLNNKMYFFFLCNEAGIVDVGDKTR